MTVQPTRDQLRALANAAADDGYTGTDNYGHLTVSPAVLTAVLDQADQAEAELDSWMARAYEAEKRAWRAEARIRAVRDVLDSYDNIRRYLSDPVINTCSEIRSALEGTN